MYRRWLLFSYLKAEFIFMILSLQLHRASVTSLFTSRIFGSTDKQCLEYTWDHISIHVDLILHVNYLQCKTPWTQSEPTLGSPCSWSCPKSLWKAYACIGLNAKCSIHLHSARHWLQLSEHLSHSCKKGCERSCCFRRGSCLENILGLIVQERLHWVYRGFVCKDYLMHFQYLEVHTVQI